MLQQVLILSLEIMVARIFYMFFKNQNIEKGQWSSVHIVVSCVFTNVIADIGL